MQKVITVNLNGRAYLIDEAGYEPLRAYLDDASHQLQANPDREEILTDLEQAIADKCAPYLNAHKNVVVQSEIQAILKVMGPVEATGDAAQPTTEQVAGSASGSPAAPAANSPAPVKKFHRISEGAVLAGICNGLAAYFAWDPVLVRIAVVVLTLLTSGALFLLYLVLIFIIPRATTDEQRAAAHGRPFNARSVVDKVKQQYT